MLTLHQFHLSPYNEKLQRMLNYKGIAFEEKYWLVGNRLTLADLAVFSMFTALQGADMAADIIAQFPRVSAWIQRVEQTTGERAAPAS